MKRETQFLLGVVLVVFALVGYLVATGKPERDESGLTCDAMLERAKETRTQRDLQAWWESCE